MTVKELQAKIRSGEIKMRWDLSPAKYAHGIAGANIKSDGDFQRIKQLAEERAGCFFFIDVFDLEARLRLQCNDADLHTKYIDVSDMHISEEVLIQAVEEAGGAVNISGHYPINKTVESVLKDILKTKSELSLPEERSL